MTDPDRVNSVCVASCIVLVILVRFPMDSQQLPYHYAMFCIWGAVEVNTAVVSGKSTGSSGYLQNNYLLTCIHQFAVRCCDRSHAAYALIYL
jgi:hypothetical protein